MSVQDFNDKFNLVLQRKNEFEFETWMEQNQHNLENLYFFGNYNVKLFIKCVFNTPEHHRHSIT
jgi:hypothetical protein